MNVNKTLRVLGAIVALGLTLTLLAQSGSAATYTWSNSGVAWSSSTNWSSTVPGTSDVGLFNSPSYVSTQPNLSSPATVGGIWDNGTGTLTIGGAI